MNIKQFTLIRNNVKPEMCYKYSLVINQFRYEIFTLNYGINFLVTIEEHCPTPRLKHNHQTILSKEVHTLQEAIEFLNINKK